MKGYILLMDPNVIFHQDFFEGVFIRNQTGNEREIISDQLRLINHSVTAKQNAVLKDGYEVKIPFGIFLHVRQ